MFETCIKNDKNAKTRNMYQYIFNYLFFEMLLYDLNRSNNIQKPG